MDEDDELGDWGIDFLDEAIKLEESYLSTQPPPPAPPIVPPPAPSSENVELHSTGQQRHKTPARDPFASFSPPRVLSQRVAGGFNDAVTDYSSVAAVRPISPSSSTRRYDSEKDLEIERLKVRCDYEEIVCEKDLMIVYWWCVNCRRSWDVSRSSCLIWFVRFYLFLSCLIFEMLKRSLMVYYYIVPRSKSVRSLRRGKAKRLSSKTCILRLTGELSCE